MLRPVNYVHCFTARFAMMCGMAYLGAIAPDDIIARLDVISVAEDRSRASTIRQLLVEALEQREAPATTIEESERP